MRVLPLELSFLQSHKLLCSVMIYIWVFHIHYDREEKWLTHSSTFTDPSTPATQTGWRESTSIWQCPGTPLKDKTTTIRLHFPASCPPYSSGHVHSNPILSPSTSVFIQYHFIRSIRVHDMWISHCSQSSGSCLENTKDCRNIAGRGKNRTSPFNKVDIRWPHNQSCLQC